MNPEKALVVFQGKKIRRTWHNNEWWFVVEDIVAVLIDSKDIKQYIQKMKQRDEELAKIQSIPSKKAEPFKIKKENLRDHMNDLELIFTMLGERVTTEITKRKLFGRC